MDGLQLRPTEAQACWDLWQMVAHTSGLDHCGGMKLDYLLPAWVEDWSWGVNPSVLPACKTEWLENLLGRETQEPVRMHQTTTVTPGNVGRVLVMTCPIIREQHYLTRLPDSQQLNNMYSFSLVSINEQGFVCLFICFVCLFCFFVAQTNTLTQVFPAFRTLYCISPHFLSEKLSCQQSHNVISLSKVITDYFHKELILQ